MVLFTNNKKLVGFKKPILFGTELGVGSYPLDEKLNSNSHIDHRMQNATIVFWQCQRAKRKTWGLKPKVGYWDIHFGSETHFNLRCLTVVEKRHK
jgi:hypothetical protein